MVLDILSAAKSVPAFPVDRWIDLSAISQARSNTAQRISWTAIYLRGWGLASQQVAQLRQSYISFPWGYLYEHPHSVASVSVHRREPASQADSLIFCRLLCPEWKSLTEIQEILSRAQRDPIDQVFKDGAQVNRLPWVLRKIVWIVLMRVWGKKKSKTIGTFTVSSLAGQNAMNRQHPLIATTSLSFSPLNEQGKSMITLQCDHRVLDGFRATEALDCLEKIFSETILQELQSLARPATECRLAS